MQTEFAARSWQEGKSAAQIADDLTTKFEVDRSRNAVIGKLNKLGMLGTRPIRVKRKLPRAQSTVADVLAGMTARSANFGKTYPLPADEVIPITAVTLEDREPHQCAWPVNHGSPFLFCGARKGAHRAFCDRHAAIAITENAPSNKQVRNYVRQVIHSVNGFNISHLRYDERLHDKPWLISENSYHKSAGRNHAKSLERT